MKKILFVTALAAAALASAPAFASGQIGASATHAEVDVAGFEGDGRLYNVFGSAATPLVDNLSVQFDGALSWTDIDDTESVSTGSGTAHFYNQTEARKIGGFFGVSHSEDTTIWNIGAEGQLFIDNFTLGAAAGYAREDDFDIDAWGLTGNATTFVTDNFSLGANVTLATAKSDEFDLEADGWAAGVGTEFQLPTLPVSLFGGYQHTEVSDFDLTIDTLTVGVAYNFGGGTLRERERTGPSLGGLGDVTSMFLVD